MRGFRQRESVEKRLERCPSESSLAPTIQRADAAIVEAARIAGCDTICTEDLQHGQDFDGVRVVNPFV